MFSLSDGKGALSFAVHASAGSSKAAERRPQNLEKSAQPDHICRSTSIFLISAMALGERQALRAGLGAIHDRVAAVEPERVLKIVEPLAACLVAAVYDPALRL